ncbi:hypothetical protein YASMINEVIRUS_1138 [Yasminevirus sp. GU-2018]|uniref:Uncharacterized protein n=1 Tax=Yasminevirus sp. GU-2018 TaxID=2420051 RepID=A0A5K0UBU4_9VIRU|nr:hypothetical protein YASMINEVIRUS_1138 [Yasminevirus sp. GU-2018]
MSQESIVGLATSVENMSLSSNAVPVPAPVQKQVVHRFTCANSACGKGYDKKAFHCYNLDCCSSKCLAIAIEPIRAEERRKEEEQRSKGRGFDHVDYGGGGAAF